VPPHANPAGNAMGRHIPLRPSLAFAAGIVPAGCGIHAAGAALRSPAHHCHASRPRSAIAKAQGNGPPLRSSPRKAPLCARHRAANILPASCRHVIAPAQADRAAPLRPRHRQPGVSDGEGGQGLDENIARGGQRGNTAAAQPAEPCVCVNACSFGCQNARSPPRETAPTWTWPYRQAGIAARIAAAEHGTRRSPRQHSRRSARPTVCVCDGRLNRIVTPRHHDGHQDADQKTPAIATATRTIATARTRTRRRGAGDRSGQPEQHACVCVTGG
jgi:hypothetical protein